MSPRLADVSSRGSGHLQPPSYLTQSGVRSWLEVASGVHHPFLLTDGVFGEPEQLLTGVGGIRAVRSGAAAHVSSLEQTATLNLRSLNVKIFRLPTEFSWGFHHHLLTGLKRRKNCISVKHRFVETRMLLFRISQSI